MSCISQKRYVVSEVIVKIVVSEVIVKIVVSEVIVKIIETECACKSLSCLVRQDFQKKIIDGRRKVR